MSLFEVNLLPHPPPPHHTQNSGSSLSSLIDTYDQIHKELKVLPAGLHLMFLKNPLPSARSRKLFVGFEIFFDEKRVEQAEIFLVKSGSL